MITLVRGLPGSGKSTIARRMVENGEADLHVEADMWFTGVDGGYKFDPDKLSENHAKCQEAVALAVASGLRVVVSNTFTQRWEKAPYLKMGVPVKQFVASGDWQNVHGVSTETIERMKARWED